MDLRKIQKTRGGTFFVTLPKDWASSSGIDQGSVVSASVTPNGRLVIDPKYDLEPTPQTATLRPSPFLNREIIGKYLLGYDIIRVEAEDRITMEQRETVKEAVQRLVGLEIIEEEYDKIVVQCLLEPAALPPEKILRREHLITSSMYRDAVRALVRGDIQLASHVIARDSEVDRLYFLVVRILRTVVQNPGLSDKLEVYPIDCLDYRLTASLVESVGDQSSQIAEHAARLRGAKLNEHISKCLLTLHEIVYEAYTDAVRAFFSRTITLAESVRGRRDEVERACHDVESMSNDLPPEISQSLASVVSLVNRIYDHSVDISDLTTPRSR